MNASDKDKAETKGLPQEQFMKAMLEYASPTISAMVDAMKVGQHVDVPPNFWEVWGGYTEILGCLDAIDTGKALLGASIRATPPISKADYMRFVITSHLHELYIMRERLAAYAKRMARLYASNDAYVLGLAKWVLDELQGVSDARSKHVHAERFNNKALLDISSYEFIANSKFTDSSDVKSLYQSEGRTALRRFRKEWQATIEANQAALSDLLNQYFETLGKVMLRDGAIVPPAPQPDETGKGGRLRSGVW